MNQRSWLPWTEWAALAGLLAAIGCGAVPSGVRNDAALETPEDHERNVLTVLVDGYLEGFRPDGQLIIENRWVAPSAIHRFSHAELASHLPGLDPATLAAFHAAARSPADWSRLAGNLPRCDVMEEREALSAYAEARVLVGPYEARQSRHEGMLSMTPFGLVGDQGQALVYLQMAWMDGRVERYFVLLDRGWIGWRKSAEWRFG